MLVLYCLMVILRFRSFCLNPQDRPGQRLLITRRTQRTGRNIPRKVRIHARPAVLRIRSYFFQLGGFGVGHFVGAVLKERDGGAAALMDDLHSAGLRIDLAYLFGVAVLDADHIDLLCAFFMLIIIESMWL